MNARLKHKAINLRDKIQSIKRSGRIKLIIQLKCTFSNWKFAKIAADKKRKCPAIFYLTHTFRK